MWRAFSLRRLLRGTAWQGSSVAPLVPRLDSEKPCQEAEMTIRSARGEGTIGHTGATENETMATAELTVSR